MGFGLYRRIGRIDTNKKEEVKMPYDSNLDNQLFTKVVETEGGRVTVSVYTYNNGPLKLQIVRENKDEEGNFRFAKLGRLSKSEVQDLLPIINEALEHM
jgi:predicted transcriptional regulator